MNSRPAFFGRDAFRDFWSNIQGAPNSEAETSEEKFLRFAPKFILPVIAILLALVIALISYLIYKRSEDGMSALLAEKGSSLLNVFESALRTGMRGQSGLQLQVLLEEISSEHGIEFVAVTLPDGTILAHSDQHRVGEILHLNGEELTWNSMAELDPEDDEQWTMTRMEGRRVFLVYRNFTMGTADWNPAIPKPIIFLGLDSSPFEITNSQNRSFVAVLSLTIMMVVLCGLLALSFAQRAVESRKRQQHAEVQVHKLEEEVRRNEKLAAMGTLAAGVAHEIRNPLSSIKGYATYFKQRFPAGSEDQEAAGVMVHEVDRLNRVITDLLGLSRPSDVRLHPIHIENVINHVKRLINQNADTRNISIDIRYAPVLPPVMGDMERLSQAILNLALNAVEAMPAGGKMTIAAAGGKENICLLIADTGTGISNELIGKIFDPYFTTKNSGTGLGLPMVHKIIKAHKGRIKVVSWLAKDSENNGKTIFKIWLPVAKDSETPTA